MKARDPGAMAVLAVLATVLVLASLSLVTAQHRARKLFVDLGRLQTQGRELDTEGAQLRIELGKAAQGSAVASAARNLGLKPADSKHTVYLPAPAENVAVARAEARR
jgi:cell division protein FtsL